jgi:hypothetical protein
VGKREISVKNALLAVIVASTIATALPSMAASSATEIKAALVGNTFLGSMGGSKYSSYFAPDGTYKDATGGGKYTIEAEGVCYPGTDYGCYQATISGTRLEWFQNGKSQGKGEIVKGNAL